MIYAFIDRLGADYMEKAGPVTSGGGSHPGSIEVTIFRMFYATWQASCPGWPRSCLLPTALAR